MESAVIQKMESIDICVKKDAVYVICSANDKCLENQAYMIKIE